MFIPSGPLSGLPSHKGAVNNLWFPSLGEQEGSLREIALCSAGLLTSHPPPEQVGGSYKCYKKSWMWGEGNRSGKKGPVINTGSFPVGGGGKVDPQEMVETKLDE